MDAKKQDMPVVRMMVLETDQPHPDTISDRGTFGEILHQHFVEVGEAHDPPLGIETDTRYIVTEEGGTMPKYSDFEGCHSLLITGSMYSATGDNPWILELLSLLKELWQHHPNMHFSGVCFGHQILCRLLGAPITSAAPTDWELGHTKLTLNPLGQRLFNTSSPTIHLHQMHQDRVASPPSPSTANGLLSPDTRVEVWGHTDHTPIQGVYIRGRLFTSQAHMEFDAGMVRRQIEVRVEKGMIEDREHAARAAETGELEHDGDVLAAALLRFFHGDDEGVE